MATKAQRHKEKLFAKIHLCVLVSWWRKFFATKCAKIITKVLNGQIVVVPVLKLRMAER